MDTDSAKRLVQLNNDFYRDNALSFSETRNAPWPGWTRVVDKTGYQKSALDVGSGNLRFQKYLNARFAETPIAHYCVDSSDSMLDDSVNVNFQILDVIGLLVDGDPLVQSLSAPSCALCTAFGFMHHIPGAPARLSLIKALVDKTLPGGYVAVSFWRFAEDAKLLAKAKASTAQALESNGREPSLSLDAGDYLLGWNAVKDTYRYCHSFTDQEIDAFIEAVSGAARLVDRFRSDGKNGQLNSYVVLEKC